MVRTADQVLMKSYHAENHVFDVELFLTDDQEVTFSLLGLDGKVMLRETAPSSNSAWKKSWSLAHLASGVYLYQISVNGSGSVFQGKILR